ncbi:collagen alpha-1(I) chain-like [Vulpes lagopus]|uniref:collagen alpha-1(I) chain-like n=1 Tax=Vulpes lagopus TaxID=494514 RepID=UPI001BC90353|nr:collagen alpha-1(I) chain-like [Vulpes lagopus]
MAAAARGRGAGTPGGRDAPRPAAGRHALTRDGGGAPGQSPNPSPPPGRRARGRGRPTASGRRGPDPRPGHARARAGTAAGGDGGRRETTAAPRHHTTPPPGGGRGQAADAGGKAAAGPGSAGAPGSAAPGRPRRATDEDEGGGGRERPPTGDAPAARGPRRRRTASGSGGGEDRGPPRGGFGKPQKMPGSPRSGALGRTRGPTARGLQRKGGPAAPEDAGPAPTAGPKQPRGARGPQPPPFTRPLLPRTLSRTHTRNDAPPQHPRAPPSSPSSEDREHFARGRPPSHGGRGEQDTQQRRGRFRSPEGGVRGGTRGAPATVRSGDAGRRGAGGGRRVGGDGEEAHSVPGPGARGEGPVPGRARQRRREPGHRVNAHGIPPPPARGRSRDARDAGRPQHPWQTSPQTGPHTAGAQGTRDPRRGGPVRTSVRPSAGPSVRSSVRSNPESRPGEAPPGGSWPDPCAPAAPPPAATPPGSGRGPGQTASQPASQPSQPLARRTRNTHGVAGRRLSHRGRIAPPFVPPNGPHQTALRGRQGSRGGRRSPARDRHRATPSARGRCPLEDTTLHLARARRGHVTAQRGELPASREAGETEERRRGHDPCRERGAAPRAGQAPGALARPAAGAHASPPSPPSHTAPTPPPPARRGGGEGEGRRGARAPARGTGAPPLPASTTRSSDAPPTAAAAARGESTGKETTPPLGLRHLRRPGALQGHHGGPGATRSSAPRPGGEQRGVGQALPAEGRTARHGPRPSGKAGESVRRVGGPRSRQRREARRREGGVGPESAPPPTPARAPPAHPPSRRPGVEEPGRERPGPGEHEITTSIDRQRAAAPRGLPEEQKPSEDGDRGDLLPPHRQPLDPQGAGATGQPQRQRGTPDTRHGALRDRGCHSQQPGAHGMERTGVKDPPPPAHTALPRVPETGG